MRQAILILSSDGCSRKAWLDSGWMVKYVNEKDKAAIMEWLNEWTKQTLK